MRRSLSMLIVFVCAFGAIGAAPARQQSTAAAADVLQRQTQELLDAVTSGSAAVWDRLLDADATITTEDGDVQTKAELVKSIHPLPNGISGRIKVIDFAATVHGSVAMTRYVSDEYETYYGQQLHCQYRTTDTWTKTAAGWRLLASQVLALRTDPPAVARTAAELAEYSGTYRLTPEIAYVVRVHEGRLEAQRTGRAVEVLLAEAPDVFFVPGRPRYRKLFRRDASGHVTALIDRREAWEIVWTRQP